MQWTHALIGHDLIPTSEIRNEHQATSALPKKIQIHSIKKGAVSPATNKVTWPETVQTNLPINEKPRHEQPRLQTVIMKQSLKLQPKNWIPLCIFG
jgi:hypothetical protein